LGGYEVWIANSDLYCGKRLYVAKRRQCSWHFQKEKDETFFVESGRLLVRYVTPKMLALIHVDALRRATVKPDEEVPAAVEAMYLLGQYGKGHSIERVLEPGDSLYVPPRMRHQFEGLSDVVLYEFSTRHRDEDSYRIVKGD
jgi:mannose-6-phosphate isomerase-like protein (cupin superfamily)